MNQYISRDNVEVMLRSIDGESIPIVFIDYMTIFYMDGSVKEVQGDKIRQYFPKVQRTTMGILKHNKEIAEISVKVDVDKIYEYVNDIAEKANQALEKAFERAIERRKDK